MKNRKILEKKGNPLKILQNNLINNSIFFRHFPKILKTLKLKRKKINQINQNFPFLFIFPGPRLVVRTEEVLIVVFVLCLWVGAIALFFNRWGKIRMLEPYQPKFQQHRASCPMVEIDASPPRQRTSLSKMSMGVSMPTTQCGGIITTSVGNSMMFGRGTYNQSINIYEYLIIFFFFPTKAYRPRQNSVFVGPQFISQEPPRKSRSAMDIHSLVLNENAEPV